MRFIRREQIIFHFILLYFTYCYLLSSPPTFLSKEEYTEGLEAKAVCVARVPYPQSFQQ